MKYKYLIQPKNYEPYFSTYYNEIDFKGDGMTVYDLEYSQYSIDGENWIDFDEDEG